MLVIIFVSLLAVIAFWLFSRPKRILKYGRLVETRTVQGYYMEVVQFEDFQKSISAFTDMTVEFRPGETPIESRYDYMDFCNVAIRYTDASYQILRIVDKIRVIKVRNQCLLRSLKGR